MKNCTVWCVQGRSVLVVGTGDGVWGVVFWFGLVEVEAGGSDKFGEQGSPELQASTREGRRNLEYQYPCQQSSLISIYYRVL